MLCTHSPDGLCMRTAMADISLTSSSPRKPFMRFLVSSSMLDIQDANPLADLMSHDAILSLETARRIVVRLPVPQSRSRGSEARKKPESHASLGVCLRRANEAISTTIS